MNRTIRNSKQVIALLLSVCMPLNTSLILAKEVRKKDNRALYERIADQYLPNYGELAQILAKEKTGDATLDEYEKRQIMFEIFDIHAKETNQKENGVLNKNSWSDLNLFGSVSEDEAIHLTGILNNTRTLMGEIKLAQMLTQPTDDINLLKKRQAVVKELVENETLFDDLDEMLKDMKKHEGDYLSFWRLRDEKRYDELYFSSEGIIKSNKSATSLEIFTRPRDIIKTGLFVWTVTSVVMLTLKIRKALGVGDFPDDPGELAKIQGELLAKGMKDAIAGGNLNATPGDAIQALSEEDQKRINNVSLRLIGKMVKEMWSSTEENLTPEQRRAILITKAFLATIAIGWLGTTLYYLKQEHGAIRLTQEVREKMYGVSEVVFSMDDATQLAAGNDVLKDGLSTLTDDGKILDGLCNKHSNLNHLVGHLNSWSVRSTAYITHYCTPIGRALAGYKLMKDEGQKLAPLMECVGELDAYLSMAKLYKKWAKHPTAKMCYVNFLNTPKPECSITGMWNPFVDQDVVVTNDMAIGDAYSTQNMIVTGPNAGGKSTMLKAIIINAIMAQSFGIACAQDMNIAPYSKMCTHLNIIDAPGIKSLFQAEVYRAQELIDTIKELKAGQFALTIMDEVFSGTNPVEGEAAAFSIGEYIAQFNQSNCIIATHYPRLTLLPQYTSNKFKNFKVYVNMLEDGTFSYPYDFVAGVADQRIAIDILEAEGFDTSILQRARDIIDNPDNYQVS